MSPIHDLVQQLHTLAPEGAGLTADSRQVRPGDVFLAIPGTVHDGREHIPTAVAAGASAVVWEPGGRDWRGWEALGIRIPNMPWSGLGNDAAGLAAEWWDHPSDALWMLGITGTNGKTSCSHWLAQCLTGLGRKTALVGTLGNGFPDHLSGTSHTTPDAVTLQGLLAGYRTAGASGVAMEVSSHALDQGRVAGVKFDVAVLTNLSRDHLDYHGTMAAYADAKARLFGWPGLSWVVLNQEDGLGQRLLTELAGSRVHTLSYGIRGGDIHAEQLQLTARGLVMDVVTPWGRGQLASTLLGRFNGANLLACLGALLASGVTLENALAALSGVHPVAGRMQRLGGDGRPHVVVDYAHTPDALEKTLATLRDVCPGRLICVFGCGGGRDKGKRPLMGGVAAAGADRAIVTSDNPRHEDPATIVADILAGMPPGQESWLDRDEAIRRAINESAPEDMILIAGKGHEDYQDIQGVRLPFSDLDVATDALAHWKGHAHGAA